VRSEIEELQGLRRGTVRLVASQALAPRFLPAAINDFRQTHPLVGFDARIGDHVQAADALRRLETELALVFNLAPEPDIERMCRCGAEAHGRHAREASAGAHPGPAAASIAPTTRWCCPTATRAGANCSNAFSRAVRSASSHGGEQQLRVSARLPVRRSSISFQMAIGTPRRPEHRGARDRGPRLSRGELVLANLRGRQLPVIAYAFAEFLKNRLSALDLEPGSRAR
jgi:DNA-binding transcriptional LysR family regulator